MGLVQEALHHKIWSTLTTSWVRSLVARLTSQSSSIVNATPTFRTPSLPQLDGTGVELFLMGGRAHTHLLGTLLSNWFG